MSRSRGILPKRSPADGSSLALSEVEGLALPALFTLSKVEGFTQSTVEGLAQSEVEGSLSKGTKSKGHIAKPRTIFGVAALSYFLFVK